MAGKDFQTHKQTHKVLLYGYDACQWCMRAKSTLREKGIDFQYFDIRANPEHADAAFTALSSSDRRTVPQVYLSNGVHIGGYAQLDALCASDDIWKVLA